MERTKIKVTGDVQGVSYRFWMKMRAEELGLLGWIKNEADGTVTVEVEGQRETIEKYLKLAEQGSPLAEVDKIETEMSDYTGQFKKFEIR